MSKVLTFLAGTATGLLIAWFDALEIAALIVIAFFGIIVVALTVIFYFGVQDFQGYE